MEKNYLKEKLSRLPEIEYWGSRIINRAEIEGILSTNNHEGLNGETFREVKYRGVGRTFVRTEYFNDTTGERIRSVPSALCRARKARKLRDARNYSFF